MTASRRIISAAIRFRGMVVSMPPPHRHHHLLHKLSDLSEEIVQPDDQGFLTDDGRYAGRGDALRVARRAGQLPNGSRSKFVLFSEDLW